MSTFQKCPSQVAVMAKSIMATYESYKAVVAAGVTIDFVFAFGKIDKDGELVGVALKQYGVPALGLCRVVNLKDRVFGRGDVEISLDGDWWATAAEDEQRALLDHELHHIEVTIDKRGIVTDDIGRPVISLKKHEFQFGWFKIIAERNGKASQECIQARQIFTDAGQAFWPDINTRLIGGVK